MQKDNPYYPDITKTDNHPLNLYPHKPFCKL